MDSTTRPVDPNVVGPLDVMTGVDPATLDPMAPYAYPAGDGEGGGPSLAGVLPNGGPGGNSTFMPGGWLPDSDDFDLPQDPNAPIALYDGPQGLTGQEKVLFDLMFAPFDQGPDEHFVHPEEMISEDKKKKNEIQKFDEKAF